MKNQPFCFLNFSAWLRNLAIQNLKYTSLVISLLLFGCVSPPTESPSVPNNIQPVTTEIQTEVIETATDCVLPDNITLDNDELRALGMPELDGGSQMTFAFDENQNLQAASVLLGLSTGPNFVAYTFADGQIQTAQFMADAYVPLFDEAGEFVALDYDQLMPLQDTLFTFQADGSVAVQNTLEPTMEQLMLILNPPLEPYDEWFQYHWQSSYEFFELWKNNFCAKNLGT